MNKTFSVTGKCGHGIKGTTKIPLPLTAEVLDCSDPEDGSNGREYIVWLSNIPFSWYVIPITEPTPCKFRARFVADAVNAFLATSEGQRTAIQCVRHSF